MQGSGVVYMGRAMGQVRPSRVTLALTSLRRLLLLLGLPAPAWARRIPEWTTEPAFWGRETQEQAT